MCGFDILRLKQGISLQDLTGLSSESGNAAMCNTNQEIGVALIWARAPHISGDENTETSLRKNGHCAPVEMEGGLMANNALATAGSADRASNEVVHL